MTYVLLAYGMVVGLLLGYRWSVTARRRAVDLELNELERPEERRDDR